MDAELEKAATYGDVGFLREALASKPTDYFLTRKAAKPHFQDAGNIFHLAASSNREDFIIEAMKSLDRQDTQLLLTQQEKTLYMQNPLHVAVSSGWFSIVQLFLDFYRSPDSKLSLDDLSASEKPWLQRDSNKNTPLHLAIDRNDEELALEILSMDMELLCNMDGKNNCSPLHAAVWRGQSRVALRILTSAPTYSVNGGFGLHPLHFVPECSEEVGRLMLARHPELVEKVDEESGLTVIHIWAQYGKLWPFQYLLQIGDETGHDWRRFILSALHVCGGTQHETPLHYAASSIRKTKNEADVVQVIEFFMDTYKQEKRDIQEASSSSEALPPWYILDCSGHTPLDVAISCRCQEVAICILSILENDSPLWVGKNPLFFAVEKNCEQVVEKFLDLMKHSPDWRIFLYDWPGKNVLHAAAKCKALTANICTLLVENLPELINERNTLHKTPLEVASENGVACLVKSILIKDNSAIKTAPSSWIVACEEGHLSTVRAFIDYCPKFHQLCIDQKDTPLHHTKSCNFKEYLDFLKIPLIREMKNAVDSHGATPLHRAIESKNMRVVKALLITHRVSSNIKDKSGKTALNLLAELCDQDIRWKVFCEHHEIILPQRTTYTQPNEGRSPMQYFWRLYNFLKEAKSSLV